MGYEEYKRKALEPIVNYIESVMASYSKEEIEARIKKALPEKESEDKRIKNKIAKCLACGVRDRMISDDENIECLSWLERQKEQKPSPSIYWHAIKKGDTLPCRAYLWTQEYEQYYGCFEGRLIPNVENVTAGADMWYLPVGDIRTLPREGIDEFPKEQNPAEWSEKDKDTIENILACLEMIKRDYPMDSNNIPNKNIIDECETFIKSIRPQPHWKPSEEQMDILDKVYHYLWADRNATADMQDGLGDFIDELKEL